MYQTITVIVDGALEEEVDFTDYLRAEAYLEEIRADSIAHGYPTEIYILEHYHLPGDDCQCIQYETDLRPFETINV